MTETRADMEARLTELCTSARLRDVYRQRDDAGLKRAIERLEEVHAEIRRHGHVHATGIDLHRI